MDVKKLAAVGAFVSANVLGSVAAQADSPKFPDLSGYAPVNVTDYDLDASTPGIRALQVFFLTPDGINCDFQTGQAQCTGTKLPGIPPASPASDGSQRVNWIGTTSRLQQITPSSTTPNGVKTLPALHSITVNGIICGVDNSGMTACKDPQGRGFVLSPHGSGWLPHV